MARSAAAPSGKTSRISPLKQAYRDAPGQRGLPFVTDTVLKNLMSRAAMDGFQVAVHAIGDQANATVLEAIEELSDTYEGDRRWRIEHAQVVDPADLPRFARSTRPATCAWPRRGWASTGSRAPMPGRA